MSKPIDWTKSHLELAYLVEGTYRDPDGNRHTVRWCGPKARTGSGLLARSSTVEYTRAFEPDLQQWEARLSRCTFDKTIGSLKQNIQALSEITLKVDIGDSDIGTGWDPESLRDMVHIGRWLGQPVRFVVADMDDLESFEIFATGTWDRDPTDISATSFKMTIDVMDAFPPTKPWPMWQVPKEVPAGWAVTPLTAWPSGPSPFNVGDNRRAPLEYKFNDSQKGKWVGQIFGGVAGLEVWRELAHYGEDKVGSGLSGYEYHYVLISPEYDQFCYEIWYMDDSGNIRKSSDGSTPFVFVWNNINPNFGPLGTVCKFAATHTMDGSTQKIFGRVAGGPDAFGHGSNYTGTLSPAQYNGTLLGQNTVVGDDATPDAFGTDPWAEPQLILKWIVGEVLGSPGDLHPDAMATLTQHGATLPVNSWNRACAIPSEIVEKPISVRAVVESLMRTIPADLVMKRDAASPDFDRKFFAVPRPTVISPVVATFTEADLYQTVPKIGVKQLSDPDGIYSNSTTIETGDYYGESTSNGLSEKTKRTLSLDDVTEQDDERTGQLIEGEIEIRDWNFGFDVGFESVAGLLEDERSRPQPVLEALHGFKTFQYELGDVIKYDIPGVYRGPGQIRSMRLDLDRQVVTVRSYHQRELPKAYSIEGDVARKNKAEQAATRDLPKRDRLRFGKARPGEKEYPTT